MTDLVIRKIPWQFDDSVPFAWQPDNPEFGIFCNLFTFIAVPFERYLIGALRKADDRLNENADVAAEAEGFLRQEAQHAAAHRKHMLALVARYPGLEQCYRDVTASYDDLIASRPVEFHAAYVANLEATFTPLFKVLLDNRDSLFDGGDRRVASLMMWHFVEEIEHRSSGLILYQHLCPNPWYRVKTNRATFQHVHEMSKTIMRAFDEHVPVDERGGISAVGFLSSNLLTGELKSRTPWASRKPKPAGAVPSIFSRVPTRQLAKMVWRLALSQSPFHDPADQPLPEWAQTWMREYDRGTDMTTSLGEAVPKRG